MSKKCDENGDYNWSNTEKNWVRTKRKKRTWKNTEKYRRIQNPLEGHRGYMGQEESRITSEGIYCFGPLTMAGYGVWVLSWERPWRCVGSKEASICSQ